jgi:glucose-1-phosphate cytidylyltransferase
MKAVILAGGLGTRISEETNLKPKPMVEIGGRPILWHVMKLYSAHGINEFIICVGYKGYVIKEYFANYFLHMSDVTFDMEQNSMEVHHRSAEPWRVTVVDTGENSMTGGRLRRVRKFIGADPFCFTYGDGVADVDIQALVANHRQSGARVTLTAVQPPGRYGALELAGSSILSFKEKPEGDGGWINGGFFVVNPDVVELIPEDSCVWEADILPKIAAGGGLNSYFHKGFWQPMDTLREKNHLEELWQSGKAPWKIWA